MRPDFSFWHFFSACFMYSSPSLSNLFKAVAISAVGLFKEATVTFRSSRQCRRIFFLSVVLYHRAHPSILVFRQFRAGWIIWEQPVPISNGVAKSTTKRRWSPTPYPTGITHAFTTATSLVAHTASIVTLPWKYVAPSLLVVSSPTTSFIPRLCRSVSSRPSSPLYIFLLASRHTINCSPSRRYCFNL